MITVLHRGGYAQMITILHREGGSLGTPKSDYVICARSLNLKLRSLFVIEARKSFWIEKYGVLYSWENEA